MVAAARPSRQTAQQRHPTSTLGRARRGIASPARLPLSYERSMGAPIRGPDGRPVGGPDVITVVYRHLAKRFHPDLDPSPEAAVAHGRAERGLRGPRATRERRRPLRRDPRGREPPQPLGRRTTARGRLRPTARAPRPQPPTGTARPGRRRRILRRRLAADVRALPRLGARPGRAASTATTWSGSPARPGGPQVPPGAGPSCCVGA